MQTEFTPEQRKAQEAYRAIKKSLVIVADTIESVHRKRAIRESERAAWLGDLATRKNGLQYALALIEPHCGVEGKFL